MEDTWARHGDEPLGASGPIGDPAETWADDPLGDEAAFPSTWQHLAGGEAAARD